MESMIKSMCFEYCWNVCANKCLRYDIENPGNVVLILRILLPYLEASFCTNAKFLATGMGSVSGIVFSCYFLI